MRLYIYAFTFCFPFYLSAQFLTPIHTDLTGEELLAALVLDFKTSTVLSSGEARDLLYAEIDNQNDTVYGIYTQHGIFLPEGVDPSIHVFMNGDANGINAEHVFPQSKGASSGNPNTDLSIG